MPHCTRLYVFVFFFSSRRRHTRFDCDWSSDVCSSDLALMRTLDAEQPDADPVNRMLCVDMQSYMVDDLLAVADRTSMAASLEVRVPYRSEERRVGKEGRSRWWPYH